MLNDKWTLQNLPPKGNPDVAKFANNLFEIANAEKEKLHKNEDFLANYNLYRNKAPAGMPNKQNSTPISLYFSNIERTVANITAKEPTGEVIDLDGSVDDAENILSLKLKKWWKETNQQQKTRSSARAMEIYGITSEKPVWDKTTHQPDILVTDPFAFFPAPGNWDDMSTESPYVCFAYLDYVDKVEKDYGVTDLEQDEAYELLGSKREEYQSSAQQKTGNYADALIPSKQKTEASDKIMERCLVIEVWVRDGRIKTEKMEEVIIDSEGEPVLDEKNLPVFQTVTTETPVYPDGVRKITISRSKGTSKKKSRSDYVTLDDSANPNINPALEVELASQTYPWGRLPVYATNSYKDLVSVWGFSAAEQVGDLISKINRIVSKLINYVVNVMAPPLIIQKHCGISRSMVEENLKKGGRLVLMPTTPNARIEFMQIPNLPATFFQVLDLIITLFDRVYAIESADRGQAPKGVTAASAIVALQERNQVLQQAKTSSIDYLAEQRSRWAIGLIQNFATKTELLNVSEETIPFTGVKYAGRKFSFVIEAGSTTPKTSLQIQELSKWLWTTKAIGQRGLLEAVGWPGWKQEVERTAESQLDQALQILISAGLPEEEAIQLKQHLIEPDQGPGGSEEKTTEAKTAKVGVPKRDQGQVT